MANSVIPIRIPEYSDENSLSLLSPIESINEENILDETSERLERVTMNLERSAEKLERASIYLNNASETLLSVSGNIQRNSTSQNESTHNIQILERTFYEPLEYNEEQLLPETLPESQVSQEHIVERPRARAGAGGDDNKYYYKYMKYKKKYLALKNQK